MTTANPAEQLIGAVLNARWRLIRLLGEGGMGAVYEADGIRGEGKRAIKMLHPEFVKEDQILQRFFAEAQASQSLKHPNIARVFESATAEDGTPYLVMELLQGIPLSTYVDQGKGIPPQQAAPIIYGVLQALQAAHAQRIVHRDLKPDNLFLVRDPRGQFVVKVLDFGIAKVMDAAGGMGSKTRTGVLLGTPGYMSPEQIKNSKGVDPRSDLWSVGIIYYEMLTAQQPFPADNEFARLTAVLTEDVRPIEKVAPHLSNWAQFFVRALAKDPNHRFQSADEMMRALAQTAGLGTGPQAQVGAPHVQIAPPTQAQAQRPTGTEQFAAHPGASKQPTPGSMAAYPQSPPQQRPPSVPPPGMQQPSQIPSAVPQQHHPSTPMQSYPPAQGVPTHVSQLRPQGTPTVTGTSPSIEVVQVPQGGAGAPWWLVAVVGAVCLGLGFVIGFIAH